MMDFERISKKLGILADAAKYDVSCSSSGSTRENQGGLGNGHVSGICHSFTEDGRCVSLLKILLTNHCIYDCAYCTSRSSNDIQRVAFTVEEVVDLTMNFYRRNYIEGLFLSSGIFKNPDFTMERLVRIAKTLRLEHQFNGYIHLKAMPKASPELLKEAGLYADRLSANLEIPTVSGLKLLAPDKKHADMLTPMKIVKNEMVTLQDMRKTIKSTPKFARAGQTSQLIVGATQETDYQIIQVANQLYKNYDLRRVYYSGYIPRLVDKRLPSLDTQVPTVRENRLYQADWLMRFYGFAAHEIVDEKHPFLDLKKDPKLAWALRHLEHFPINVQSASLEMILRIPGIGAKTAHKMVKARRFGQLTYEAIARMGGALNRAQYFMQVTGNPTQHKDWQAEDLEKILMTRVQSKFNAVNAARGGQLDLFDEKSVPTLTSITSSLATPQLMQPNQDVPTLLMA